MTTIKLSPEQYQHLVEATYLPHDLRQILDAHLVAAPGGSGILQLNGETAEAFRMLFTEQLAQHGFGPNYELSSEGAMLEELIDRFGQ
jgi:hypothetical protein